MSNQSGINNNDVALHGILKEFKDKHHIRNRYICNHITASSENQTRGRDIHSALRQALASLFQNRDSENEKHLDLL